MHPIRSIALPALAAAIVSCAPQKDDYDTSNPYGTPDAGATAGVNAPYQPNTTAAPAAPGNPTYDTPAAYEETGGAPAAIDPTAVNPANTAHDTAPPANTARGAAVHVVVKGDTLGGIAAKYKVPMASIKAANNMKNDTVVLGKKLTIPTH